MSMPKIPDINPNINVDRQDVVNIIIASIAMEELALAHILNAEGEKLQYVLGTLDEKDPGEVTICDVMAVNNSIQKTLRDVIKTEMLLQFKLEDAIELSENGNECQLTIKGQKIWRDSNNVAGKRPASVTITLFRDDKVYDTRTVSSTGDGKYTFQCLPVWKDSVNKYEYRVDEVNVPAGYTKIVNGYNIINTIGPGSITIDCSKTWVDNNDADKKRPGNITVNLMRNGTQAQTQTVTSPVAPVNTMQFSFTNAPQFDNEGTQYAYTLEEIDVAGYTKNINGFNITNTY